MPGPTDAPTPLEVRNRAARRCSHRRLSLVTVAVAVLVGAGVMWVVQDDDPARRVTAGPGTEDHGGFPGRTLGDVEGVTVTVSPRTGLGDGEIVEVDIDGLTAR